MPVAQACGKENLFLLVQLIGGDDLSGRALLSCLVFDEGIEFRLRHLPSAEHRADVVNL